MMDNLLRQLPSIDKLKKTSAAGPLIAQFSEDLFVAAAREVINNLRSTIKANDSSVTEELISQDAILQQIELLLTQKFTLSLRKAVNATGVILHTGLGRAALPEAAQAAIASVADGYSTLATDIQTGQRSHRDHHLNDLICEVTGAEAATAANNNAAATMLILNTLAQGMEVIVSRGQLVEIGGAFRMPDVMTTSGAILKEVGTTNKTHLRDYAMAIGENTGAIMRVHHSNYRIVGFASEPGIEELTELAQKHSLQVIDDLGSGALVDLMEYGIEHEPLVQDSIRAGVDVACFSADKLIGGPQAGIIVGKASIIEKIRKNPLARAFRIGKLTIAGLETTFRLFLTPEKLKTEHPLYRMFSMTSTEIERRAKRIIRPIRQQMVQGTEINIIDGGSQVGSGAVPVETIPTRLIQIFPGPLSSTEFAAKLRQNNPPIFTRVQKEAVLLDLRTVFPKEDNLLKQALLTLLS